MQGALAFFYLEKGALALSRCPCAMHHGLPRVPETVRSARSIWSRRCRVARRRLAQDGQARRARAGLPAAPTPAGPAAAGAWRTSLRSARTTSSGKACPQLDPWGDDSNASISVTFHVSDMTLRMKHDLSMCSFVSLFHLQAVAFNY